MSETDPVEPAFLEVLRSFVKGGEFHAAEISLAANAYLALLREHLLATQEVLRAAALVAPAQVERALSRTALVPTQLALEQIHGGVRAPWNGVRALLEADPVLATTAVEVAAAYRARGIAFARSASLDMTERVQRKMGELRAAPPEERSAGAILSDLTGWAESYSRTAYRTAAAGARTAAKFETQNQPFVSQILIGFRVFGSDDADTRRGRPVDRGEHHKAVLGLTAATNDPIWETHSPPYGFNCRHFLRSVSRMEARRRGWLDAEGNLVRQEPPDLARYSPAPGFGQKPRTGT